MNTRKSKMNKEIVMNRLKAYIVAIVGFFAIASSGCVSTVGNAPSISPMQNKKITKNLGKTSGTASSISVLSLWMVGKPDINAAIAEALQKKGGDTLINVKVSERFLFFGIVSVTTVIVEGEAVKISGAKR